jgi:hypothetical protein
MHPFMDGHHMCLLVLYIFGTLIVHIFIIYNLFYLIIYILIQHIYCPVWITVIYSIYDGCSS